jgi:hypothetical protein
MFFVSQAPERGKSGNNSTTSHHAPSASHAQLGGVEIDEHFCLGGSYGVNASGTRNVLERTMPRQSIKSRSYLAHISHLISKSFGHPSGSMVTFRRVTTE